MFSHFSKKGGFTLIEMMVVVAIVIIMTAIVLADLPAFRDRSSLELVAQEIALVIREAQSFGAITRGVTSGSGAQFPSYGVFFHPGPGTPLFISDKSTSFILFSDPSNAKFDGDQDNVCGGDNQCREVYNIPNGLFISAVNLCTSSGGTETCGGTAIPYLNLIFARPNPEALFSNETGVPFGNICNSSTCSYAKITLQSQKSNATRSICVWTTGHIYTTAESTTAGDAQC